MVWEKVRLPVGPLPSVRRRLELWAGIAVLAVGGVLVWSLDEGFQRHGDAAPAAGAFEQVGPEEGDWSVDARFENARGPAPAQAANETGRAPWDAGGEKAQAEPEPSFGDRVESAARGIAARVRRIVYGILAIDPVESDRPGSYPPGSVFHDRLVNPAGAAAPGRFSIFRDRFKRRDASGAAVDGPEMVVLPGGEFRMGCAAKSRHCADDEKPAHGVAVEPFAMGRHEVTFEEYGRFVAAKVSCRDDAGRPVPIEEPDDAGWGKARRPVIGVDWHQARCYVRWLSEQTGQRYRLPTEAEWEYAARAGTETAWHWGDDPAVANLHAWHRTNAKGRTHPVGGKHPSVFGLFDTAGNVWEWTEDCWHADYRHAPADGSAWRAANGGQCDSRVVRGGSWLNSPRILRPAFRGRIKSDVAGSSQGFRVARDL